MDLLIVPYMESSINDVTAVGGQEFSDNISEALVLKSVVMRDRGCKKLLEIVWRH